MHSLEQALDCQELVSPTADYASLAGMLLSHSGHMPTAGDVVELHNLRFEIIEVSDYRIELVRITKLNNELEE